MRSIPSVMTDEERLILQDDRPVKEMTLSELRTQLAVFCRFKIWGGKYFSLNNEVQHRATAAWVKEDVFGHTFTGVK